VFLTLKVEIHNNTDRSFELWCWKSKEKIGWIDLVKNGELQTVKGEGNILNTKKRRKGN